MDVRLETKNPHCTSNALDRNGLAVEESRRASHYDGLRSFSAASSIFGFVSAAWVVLLLNHLLRNSEVAYGRHKPVVLMPAVIGVSWPHFLVFVGSPGV